MLCFQSSEGREYLVSLEHTAVWVAERVLPFLVQNSSDGEEDLEKTRPLAAQITEVNHCLNH